MTKLKPKYKTIALTGPQGSGKTTQLKLLLEKVDAEFASVGDILRSILPHSEKPEHQEARDLMYAGKLIPEQITFEILKDYFAEKQKTGATKEVLIFDGFPRSAEQAEHLYELNRAYHGVVDGEMKGANASGATENLPHIAVIRMQLEHEHAKRRCLDRAEAQIQAGKAARVDDTDEAISQRLAIYFDSVPHLDRAFADRAHVHEFDGTKEREEIHGDILKRLFE